MNLKELANHLGLSQTTVSRALNGYPEVSERTRQRIMAVAEEVGYQPNVLARRLATGRTGLVALLLPTDAHQVMDVHLSSFLGGLCECVTQAELDLAIKTTRRADEIETYRQIARTRRFDAVVVSAPRVGDQRIAALADTDLAFIVHGRTEAATRPYAYLDLDHAATFRHATNAAIERGHRRIALINADTEMAFARDRESGWRAALRDAGCPLTEAHKAAGPLSEDFAYRSAREMLTGAAATRPTALLCSTVLQAHAVARAARDLGLSVGRDVSLIAHDDDLPFVRAETFDPPLTTTFSSSAKAGYRAGELLLARLAGQPVETLQEVWQAELIVRDSLQAAPV